jgi:hypothetical protein
MIRPLVLIRKATRRLLVASHFASRFRSGDFPAQPDSDGLDPVTPNGSTAVT